MRIDRLDLARYGKFTDRSIEFPAAKRDFHLLVGANEAGKSTVRDAILDLLFGIEMRSAYDFLHPKAEMRLGACVSEAGRPFEFQRIKKAKSLLDAQGAALPDDALMQFLGSADRSFYDQMFGLDHGRLIAGGNEILKASNDVGRILFQSAAGIGSLGTVRDALEAEADKLWAKRKSGDRAYYIAADALASAESALKHTVMRTRAWTDASTTIDARETELAALRERFRALQDERVRLERVRRVAPLVRAFNDASIALAALGEAPELPPDALAIFEAAEAEFREADSQLRITQGRAQEARSTLAQIDVDQTALQHAAAIEALVERVQQTRSHALDIEKRQLEVDTHREAIANLVRQLGWKPASAQAGSATAPTLGRQEEEWLEQRLPTRPVRTAINELIKRKGAIEHAVVTATTAVSARRRTIEMITLQLANAAQVEAPPELSAALAEAHRLGDFDGARRRDEIRLATARQTRDVAFARLGKWRIESERLSTLALPASEVIRQLRNEHERLDADRRARSMRKAELEVELARKALEIDQLRKQHHAVTRDDLNLARNDRDMLWRRLRDGDTTLQAAAGAYELKVGSADELADLRHDNAQEAANLQGRIEQREHLQLQIDDIAGQLADIDAALARIDHQWSDEAGMIGFPDMPLLAFEEWRGALGQALSAAESVEQADAELALQARTIAESTTKLTAALHACGEVPPAGCSLDTLIETARSRTEAATASRAGRQALQLQHDEAIRALGETSDALAQAQAALADWQHAWVDRLASAGLPESTSVGAAEGALDLFAAIDEHLNEIRKVRKARIETMQKDLDDLARTAAELTARLAPGLAGKPAAELSAGFMSRLAKAREDHRDFGRLSAELQRLDLELAHADEQRRRAELRIAPLLERVGTASRPALREAIIRSDERRLLAQAMLKARQAAEAGGDGLSLQALCDEVDRADLAAVAARLAELPDELEAASENLSGCNAKLTTARAERDRIAGQDDAARAETARQEALARMADAAERFIKVHIGARLLRWAIDRYRETRQGPLLARASEIFAGLTLGSFIRLVVDFESDPPTLDGMRPSGATVGVAGLSDGTRDQLYLALRLAALEMHIEQAHALPFLADDLFINYDDDRSRAGLEALATLSERTQIVFMTHHEHLVPVVRSVFGNSVNVVSM